MVNITLRPMDEAPITLWLQRWAEGDQAAAAALAQAMLPLLRRAAVRLLGAMPDAANDYSPTLLVGEVWLRLSPQAQRRFDNRRHFFGTAIQIMRYALIDHLRRHRAHLHREQSGHDIDILPAPPDDFATATRIDVIRILEHLRQRHPRQSEVLLLTKVLGCEMAEVAEQLDISIATVKRDLRFAEAFVKSQLGEQPISDT